MSVGVIIVAAGRSRRMGGATPKPLLELAGLTVLRRSVAAFDAHPEVEELVVVLPAEWVDAAPTVVGPTSRRCQCVAGGAERHDSVRRGFAVCRRTLMSCLFTMPPGRLRTPAYRSRAGATRETGAAVPAVPARDTVKRVDRSRRLVVETIPREEIWLAQTPQGFSRSVLSAAMAAETASTPRMRR